MGHVCELVDDGILDFSSCMSIGPVEQQRVPGRVFHDRADRGLPFGSDDQVAFAVARERPVFHPVKHTGDILDEVRRSI